MMNKKNVALVLIVVIVVSMTVAVYTFFGRSRFDKGLLDKLHVDDMKYSKAYGWIFIRHENYNGEFVLYIEGLHRILFATPVSEETPVSGKPDIVIRLEKELQIHETLLIYGGNQYAIVEYGAYTLPLWVSESLVSGEVKAFTSLGQELSDVQHDSFPILDAITLYRVNPIMLSPYANYFIDVTECRVYDNVVEYLVTNGASVIFQADAMEYVRSTDPEIDRAYREGEPDHAEEDDI